VGIKRVVPDIISDQLEKSRDFYLDVLGFEVAMDMGWIVTLTSPDEPAAQISLFPFAEDMPLMPSVTVEVDDVDKAHDAVTLAGYEVVYPMTDEEWGVRRFFVLDPGGVVVNVMSHLDR